MLDHVVRMQEHYNAVRATQQAGAVTYFAFLSFFPLLALAVFVVGRITVFYPDADTALRDAIDAVIPGMIGPGRHQISLDDIRTFSGIAATVGIAGVLYAGLGWVSALRRALAVVFEVPEGRQPGFVAGKLRDLFALVVLGAVLFVGVAVTGLVSGFSDNVLDWLGLSRELGWVVRLLTVALGLLAGVLVFFLMFRLLADPAAPTRSLWSGALLGALAFEVLKQASGLLLGSTKGQPAFQAFGIALILLVWMNYTSRVVLYGACWAWTTPQARARRLVEPVDPVQGPRMPSREEAGSTDPARPTRVAAFIAGAATAALLRRLVHRKET
nr:YihY/virulence factor BrkB family protein [Nocardioides sp. zg-DK7169]